MSATTRPTREAAVEALGDQVIRLNKANAVLKAQVAARHAAGDPQGIELAAYALLFHLVKEGPRRASALAETACVDPSTVSRQVAGLVRAGLVERRPDPEDGRATLLAPTDEGLRVFQANRDRRNREIGAMTEHWDEADRVRLAELLEQLAGDLEHHHAPTPPSAALRGQEAS